MHGIEYVGGADKVFLTFESTTEIQDFLLKDEEEISMSELWDIVKYQQELDLFL